MFIHTKSGEVYKTGEIFINIEDNSISFEDYYSEVAPQKNIALVNIEKIIDHTV